MKLNQGWGFPEENNEEQREGEVVGGMQMITKMAQAASAGGVWTEDTEGTEGQEGW